MDTLKLLVKVVLCVPLFCFYAASGIADSKLVPYAKEFVIDASKRGPIFDFELVGNASRLLALVPAKNSVQLSLSVENNNRAIEKSLQARYRGFESIRVGNLFFGYECAGWDFKELAIRGQDGRIVYQFDETIQILELVVKAGFKPRLALTGIPKALVPKGEPLATHPAYGCVNAPPIDWTKTEPKERMSEFWQLQNAFFKALIDKFGKKEISGWEFATWTEPVNRLRHSDAHLVLPVSVLDAGKHDDAVATIIAASIDAAIENGVKIHVGNFAGDIANDYPVILKKVGEFSRGQEYLKYITGYAISRYRVKPSQDINVLMDAAFRLLNDRRMPDKPMFIDEIGELADNEGHMPPSNLGGIEEAEFIGNVLRLVNSRPRQPIRSVKRIAFWSSPLSPRQGASFLEGAKFLPTAATNFIFMLSSLKGGYSLAVSGGGADQVFGVLKDDSIRGVFVHGNNAGQNLLKVVQLKPNRTYLVTTEQIDENNGNPVSEFLKGGGYTHDRDHKLSLQGAKWRFSSSYWEGCYFDETPDCKWRDKAELKAAPYSAMHKAVADGDGVVSILLPTVSWGVTGFSIVETR